MPATLLHGGLALVFLIASGLACGKIEMWPQQQRPAAPLTEEPAGKGGAADAAFLYGSWRGTGEINGMPCEAQHIFQRNGTYSGMAGCDNGFGGSYMTRSVGDWKMLGPGTVRIEYTDHEPKEFGGRKMHYPTGETINFTVKDNDHIETSSGVLRREK